MKTLTLNLSDSEMEVLESLCRKKALSKTTLLRQCLRLYQAVETRLDTGQRLFFENNKSEKSELVLV